MITRKFIKKVHVAFDELNYRETEKLNIDEFETAAVKTLTHCKDIEDAKSAIKFYQFCLKKWNKIQKIFDKKLWVFNSYEYKGNSLISLVTDEEAAGTYYVTNGVNGKVKDVFVSSYVFEDDIISFENKHDKFVLFSDGEYYLQYAMMSSVKMKLFDTNKDCLCNIVLSDTYEIFLENNKTPYALIVYDWGVGIFDKNYIGSLNDNAEIDDNRVMAEIEWDLLEEKSELGVSRLVIYSEEVDVEMVLFFAAATFLLYQNFMQTLKKRKSFNANMRTAFLYRGLHR